MKRIGILGVGGLCLGLAIGCGGRTDERAADEARDANEIDIADTTTIVETGCLTAAGDRFALAALESGGRTETELYQLIGSEDELRPHVGREVRVTGMAEPAQVATIRESSAATPTGTSGTASPRSDTATSDMESGSQPQVSTETQTRLETRRMRVATVSPTGDECPAAGR